MDYVPIEAEGYFAIIKEINAGIILITDTDTGNHVHVPSCPFVTAPNFEEKVITNECKNGNYYWLKNASKAEDVIKPVTRCKICNPV